MQILTTKKPFFFLKSPAVFLSLSIQIQAISVSFSWEPNPFEQKVQIREQGTSLDKIENGTSSRGSAADIRSGAVQDSVQKSLSKEGINLEFAKVEVKNGGHSVTVTLSANQTPSFELGKKISSSLKENGYGTVSVSIQKESKNSSLLPAMKVGIQLALDNLEQGDSKVEIKNYGQQIQITPQNARLSAEDLKTAIQTHLVKLGFESPEIVINQPTGPQTQKIQAVQISKTTSDGEAKAFVVSYLKQVQNSEVSGMGITSVETWKGVFDKAGKSELFAVAMPHIKTALDAALNSGKIREGQMTSVQIANVGLAALGQSAQGSSSMTQSNSPKTGAMTGPGITALSPEKASQTNPPSTTPNSLSQEPHQKSAAENKKPAEVQSKQAESTMGRSFPQTGIQTLPGLTPQQQNIVKNVVSVELSNFAQAIYGSPENIPAASQALTEAALSFNDPQLNSALQKLTGAAMSLYDGIKGGNPSSQKAFDAKQAIINSIPAVNKAFESKAIFLNDLVVENNNLALIPNQIQGVTSVPIGVNTVKMYELRTPDTIGLDQAAHGIHQPGELHGFILGYSIDKKAVTIQGAFSSPGTKILDIKGFGITPDQVQMANKKILESPSPASPKGSDLTAIRQMKLESTAQHEGFHAYFDAMGGAKEAQVKQGPKAAAVIHEQGAYLHQLAMSDPKLTKVVLADMFNTAFSDVNDSSKKGSLQAIETLNNYLPVFSRLDFRFGNLYSGDRLPKVFNLTPSEIRSAAVSARDELIKQFNVPPIR